MIKVTHKGNFKNSEALLKKAKSFNMAALEEYAQQGLDALRSATPVDTGKTAASWYYQIVKTKNGVDIQWLNSNIVDGVPIAIILQYGHGTNNGGYVQGIDYINPALKPIFNKILKDAWKEVFR